MSDILDLELGFELKALRKEIDKLKSEIDTYKKVIKDSDIVITGLREDGSKFRASAQSFNLNSFKGCEVSGEKYYVDKAVELGAKKSK